MRDIFESEIPDTAPYKEWLCIVGSMLVAVLICAVLFAGGVLTRSCPLTRNLVSIGRTSVVKISL